MKDHQISGGRSGEKLVQDNLIVKHYAGSMAYGTNIATSDTDFRGIFCGDPINVRTPFFVVRECEDQLEEDTKFYELSHFMKLCLDCNPNIIETLWVDDSDIVIRTPAYDLLRANRAKLLSSKVAFTFSGYAIAQLKRIKGHNKHINKPQPEMPPQPKNFLKVIQWFGSEKNLNPIIDIYNEHHRLVPFGNDMYGVFPAPDYRLWNNIGTLNTEFQPEERERYTGPLMLVKWNRQEYKVAKEEHRKYWEWKNNRNDARGELEEQFGYDTKHAMHLVRLLRMGVEILRHHDVIVKRPDAAELLEIRNGAWSYDELLEYSTDMDIKIREVWYNNTSLPKKPNIKFAANLLMDLQDMVWGTNE